MAKKLGLSSSDENALLVVLLEEQRRRAGVLREMYDEPNEGETRARARAALDAILAWKTQELRSRFGPGRAAAMMQR